jgi:hypothetical protein
MEHQRSDSEQTSVDRDFRNTGFTKGGEFLEMVGDSKMLIKGRGYCSTPNFLDVDKKCTFKSLVEMVSTSLCLPKCVESYRNVGLHRTACLHFHAQLCWRSFNLLTPKAFRIYSWHGMVYHRVNMLIFPIHMLPWQLTSDSPVLITQYRFFCRLMVKKPQWESATSVLGTPTQN